MMPADPFTSPKYEARRKYFSLDRSCDVFNLKEERVFKARMRPFQKHVHLQFVRAETPESEALFLEAKTAGGLNAIYDVLDPFTGGLLGAFERKGLNAFLKNEWEIVGLDGRRMGMIREDTASNAVVKRLFGSPLPQRYSGWIGETQVCNLEQSLTTFSFSITVRFLPAGEGLLDRRICLAAAILLCLVEGRQRSLVGNI
jgi:hypothetical protein